MAKIPRTLAERVDWLFKHIRRPDGGEYTYQEVEAGTKELGYSVTGAYVWKMRKGKAEKPNWLIVRVLARFFKIPITFFYDEKLTEEKLARILRTENKEVSAPQVALRRRKIPRDPDVEEITSRVSKLNKADRQTILQVIRLVTGRGSNA